MAAQNIPYCLIRHLMTQVGEGTDDPVIAPAGILSRHPDHQSFHFRRDRRATWILPVFRAVELLGHEPSIPGQDRVRLRDAGHLPQRLAAEPFSDLGQSCPLRIGKPQS